MLGLLNPQSTSPGCSSISCVPPITPAPIQPINILGLRFLRTISTKDCSVFCEMGREKDTGEITAYSCQMRHEPIERRLEQPAEDSSLEKPPHDIAS